MRGRYTEREILHALDKAEADAKAILREEGMPDDWEGGWTPPESLTERTRLADGARTKIALARASRRRGDADSATKHQNDARDLLDAARLAATQEARRNGGLERAKRVRAKADAHWSTTYLEQAHRQLANEGRKVIGRRALAAKARQLASIDERDNERRSEITERRARQYLERLLDAS